MNIIRINLLVLLFMCLKTYSTELPFVSMEWPYDESNSALVFIENKGQIRNQFWESRSDVLFYTEANGLNFYLLEDGISYQLYNKRRIAEVSEYCNESIENDKELDSIGIYRVDMKWIDSGLGSTIIPVTELYGHRNYYNVPNNSPPALHVKHYENLLVKDVWEGIDLFIYFKDGVLETDWIVEKAEDFERIKFQILGADFEIDSTGNLNIFTPYGTIREDKPIANQNGKNVAVNWSIGVDNHVGFDINCFQKGQDLTIDPPVRLWGSYYGGLWADEGRAVSSDNEGNVFLAGHTPSLTQIATEGAHQVYNNGLEDAFLVKFDSNGVRQWATYYGGEQNDRGYDCTTDLYGNVFLIGTTQSHNNISTDDSHQPQYGGGNNGGDAFLAKFDSQGIRLWGTYYGGANNEAGVSCDTDHYDNVFVAGRTSSQQNIASAGAHQTSLKGLSDAFLVKFNGEGIREWGTYYGGSFSEQGNACATDNTGNVYLTGFTSTNFDETDIATDGAHQAYHGGGGFDAFLVKLDPYGVRQWGTFYGGSGIDHGKSCITDSHSNIYLLGDTESGNNIATENVHQNAFGGHQDAFVAKFDSNGIRQWGTYYGGEGSDYGNAIAIGHEGDVFIFGSTSSHTGIATEDAYQPTYGGNHWDAFVTKLNDTGERVWGTYFGSAGLDIGRGGTVDKHRRLYLVGTTNSISDISTPGSHQPINGGGSNDAFIVKFEDDYQTGFQSSGHYIGFEVFPVPAVNELIIQLPHYMLIASTTIYIYGPCGRLVKQWKPNNFTCQLEIGDFAPGLYFLKANDGRSSLSRAIIKVK